MSAARCCGWYRCRHNSHGAVLLGALLLGCWGVGTLAPRLPLRGERTPASATPPVAAIVALALASGAALLSTPLGIDLIRMAIALEGSPLQQITSEYRGALRLWEVGQYKQQAMVALLYLLTLAALPALLRRDRLDRALPTLLTALFALSAMRYLPFMLVVAAPYAALGAQQSLARWSRKVALRLSAGRHRRPAAGALIALLGVWGGSLLRAGQLYQGGLEAGRFPLASTAALADSAGGGRVFTTINWGGYLIWHLHPRFIPYVDGRMLQPSRLRPYVEMLEATPIGRRWFDQEGFDLVLLPRHIQGGDAAPRLIAWLRHDPRWRVVWATPGEVLFARAGR